MMIAPQDFGKIWIQTSNSKTQNIRHWMLKEDKMTGQLKLEEL